MLSPTPPLLLLLPLLSLSPPTLALPLHGTVRLLDVCASRSLRCRDLPLRGCPDICAAVLDPDYRAASPAAACSRRIAPQRSFCASCPVHGFRRFRMLDFDGPCAADHLRLFLQHTTQRFLDELSALPLAVCGNVAPGNVFQEQFFDEAARIFCEHPSRSTGTRPSMTPAPRRLPPAQPATAASPAPSPASNRPVLAPSAPPATPSPSPRAASSAVLLPASPAKANGPRLCVRKLRMCMQRPKIDRQLPRGAYFHNRQVHRQDVRERAQSCCSEFCRCRRAKKTYCKRWCMTTRLSGA